jgi:hypothetical protein
MSQLPEQITADQTGARDFARGSATRFDSRKNLSSYSVDLQLLLNIEEYINNKVPGILSAGNGRIQVSDHTTLIISGAKDIRLFHPAAKYTQPLFDNDTEAVTIELLHKETAGPGDTLAIVIILRLSRTYEDSYLSIALQDTNPGEKGIAIEKGLLAVMEPHRVAHRIAYPNEFVPTLLFVIGFLIGITGLMFQEKIIRFLTTLAFGVAMFLVAYRFTKGYCVFRSARQKWLDALLKLIGGILVIIILASILT